MFTELRIRNYRLFKDLTIKDLMRINLFVGKNNSGKSTVAEAITLVAGGYSPYVPFQLNRERAMKVPKDELAFESYLRSLFRDLDRSKELVVTAKHSEFGLRTCRITTTKAPVASVLTDRPATESIGKLPSQVVLAVCMKEEDDRYLQYQIFQDGEKPVLTEMEESTPSPHPFSIDYVPANLELGELVFRRLSELRKEKRTEFLLGVLRQIEPRLKDVPEILTHLGPENLFCDIVGIHEKVPLGLMGQGLTRVLRLVLMMDRGTSEEGIMVIDEIENGIHHESMSDVWRAIGVAAHKYDKQVFATTHSYECLRSANEALDSSDLAIHRLEVDGDRTTRCVTLGPEAVEGAISNGFEIR